MGMNQYLGFPYHSYRDAERAAIRYENANKCGVGIREDKDKNGKKYWYIVIQK